MMSKRIDYSGKIVGVPVRSLFCSIIYIVQVYKDQVI